MRILANFTKKVSTGQYENETFTVTIEAESEFNNIAVAGRNVYRPLRGSLLAQSAGWLKRHKGAFQEAGQQSYRGSYSKESRQGRVKAGGHHARLSFTKDESIN